MLEPNAGAGVLWIHSSSPRLAGAVSAATARGEQPRPGTGDAVISLRLIGITLALGALLACEAPRAIPRAEGVVYVVPVGDPSPDAVERARWAAGEQTHRLVILEPARRLPRVARVRGGYRAGELLDALLEDAPEDAFRIVGVTDAPLVDGHDEAVIGYARTGERALVYSTDELPVQATEAAHRRRVRRIVAHELGHTFGALHCSADCVMQDTHSAHDIDLMPDHFCPEHGQQFRAGLAAKVDDPEVLSQLGAERMRLGRWEEASRVFRDLARVSPHDQRPRTALGIAQMANGELTAAEESFEIASRIDPKAPQPFYARAVLYAAGRAVHRAPAYLEAAVARDPDGLRAHRAAGILYQDWLGDPARAAHHFESHVLAGGRDPDVITRLVYLSAPATVTFTQGDTIIARWDPKRGLLLARADFTPRR